MLTYTFYHKNNSNFFVTSQDSAEDAWKELEETVKDTWGWRLEDDEEEEDDTDGQGGTGIIPRLYLPPTEGFPYTSRE